jgi:hypothetical protein
MRRRPDDERQAEANGCCGPGVLEPDWLYRSSDTCATGRRAGVHRGLFVLWMDGDNSVFALDKWDQARRLTIHFDASGVVTRVAVDSSQCSQGNSYVIGDDDCTQPSMRKQERTESRQRWNSRIKDAGAILARYGSHLTREPEKTACSAPPQVIARGQTITEQAMLGDQLIIAERWLLWRSSKATPETWQTLAVARITTRPVRPFYTPSRNCSGRSWKPCTVEPVFLVAPCASIRPGAC